MIKNQKLRTSAISICIVILSGAVLQASGQTAKRGSGAGSSKAPEWYVNVPSDSTGLIARGTGKSKDKQVAIDKAIAAARRILARTVDRKWSALARAIEKESGERCGAKLGSMVLVNSTVLKQSAMKRGRLWIAYALVNVPQTAVRQVLDQRLHEDAEWFSRVQETKTVKEFEAPAHEEHSRR